MRMIDQKPLGIAGTFHSNVRGDIHESAAGTPHPHTNPRLVTPSSPPPLSAPSPSKEAGPQRSVLHG